MRPSILDPDTATERISLTFSADGTRAACLAATGDGRWTVEAWEFTPDGPRVRRLPTPDGEKIFSQVVPVARNVLTVRDADDGPELAALQAGPTGVRRRVLTRAGHAALRLLPWPGDTALAITTTAGGHSTLGDARIPETRITVPGRLTGGTPLDPAGHSAGFTWHTARGPRVLRVDLRTGTVAEPAVAGDRPTYLITADRFSGRSLVAVQTVDGLRAGYVDRLGSTPPVLPDALAAFERPARALALAPGGGAAAFLVAHGASSGVHLHEVDTDRITALDAPAGVFTGSAAWSRSGLRLGHRSPVCASGVLTAIGDPLAVHPAPAAAWAPAHVETFAIGSGPVEAVVYGDRRRADRLLVALHGGPDSAWHLDFQPFFQRLAAAGFAVVAPNQRGSTGYGAAHADAIRGAWGGPDGDDVIDLGRLLVADRRRHASLPMLFGRSYGGYLALQVLRQAPALWSRAATVAAFAGPETLRADAPATRALIDRLDGRSPAGGVLTTGPVGVPLLLMHGQDDETIPIAHAHRLHRLLTAHDAAAPVVLHPVPGAGHDPLTGPHSRAATEALLRFLTGSAHRIPSATGADGCTTQPLDRKGKR